MDHPEDDHRPSIREQIGLALRARRREQGESQRDFAARTGLSKSTLARLESSPGRMRLDDIADVLAEAGFALMVVETAAEGPCACRTPPWIPTDLVARTRGGSRFPAHLAVHRTEWGPGWWWLDEMLRPRRPFGPQPQWSTEGSRRKDDWSSMLADTYGYGEPRPERAEPGPEAGPTPGS